MPRALVTGVNGFCGRHLAARLRQEGVAVAGADLGASPATADLDEYQAVDVLDYEAVATLVGAVRPDWVFNLAGVMDNGAGPACYRVNLLGALHVVEAVRERAPGAGILLVGSAAEYGDVSRDALPVRETQPCRPTTPYGISKYAMTLAAFEQARRHRLKVSVARPFNIVGAGMPPGLVLGGLLDQARRAWATEGPVVARLGSLDARRDFVAVEDVADAYLRFASRDLWGEVFNVCSEVSRRVADVVALLVDCGGGRLRVEIDPAVGHDREPAEIYGSGEKARRAAGFAPSVDLGRTLRRAWRAAVGEPA